MKFQKGVNIRRLQPQKPKLLHRQFSAQIGKDMNDSVKCEYISRDKCKRVVQICKNCVRPKACDEPKLVKSSWDSKSNFFPLIFPHLELWGQYVWENDKLTAWDHLFLKHILNAQSLETWKIIRSFFLKNCRFYHLVRRNTEASSNLYIPL